MDVWAVAIVVGAVSVETVEADYYRNGGILAYGLRSLAYIEHLHLKGHCFRPECSSKYCDID